MSKLKTQTMPPFYLNKWKASSKTPGFLLVYLVAASCTFSIAVFKNKPFIHSRHVNQCHTLKYYFNFHVCLSFRNSVTVIVIPPTPKFFSLYNVILCRLPGGARQCPRSGYFLVIYEAANSNEAKNRNRINRNKDLLRGHFLAPPERRQRITL